MFKKNVKLLLMFFNKENIYPLDFYVKSKSVYLRCTNWFKLEVFLKEKLNSRIFKII